MVTNAESNGRIVEEMQALRVELLELRHAVRELTQAHERAQAQVQAQMAEHAHGLAQLQAEQTRLLHELLVHRPQLHERRRLALRDVDLAEELTPFSLGVHVELARASRRGSARIFFLAMLLEVASRISSSETSFLCSTSVHVSVQSAVQHVARLQALRAQLTAAVTAAAGPNSMAEAGAKKAAELLESNKVAVLLAQIEKTADVLRDANATYFLGADSRDIGSLLANPRVMSPKK